MYQYSVLKTCQNFVSRKQTSRRTQKCCLVVTKRCSLSVRKKRKKEKDKHFTLSSYGKSCITLALAILKKY